MPGFAASDDPINHSGFGQFGSAAPQQQPPQPEYAKAPNFVDNTLPAVMREQASYRAVTAIDDALRGRGSSTVIDPTFNPVKEAQGTPLEGRYDVLAGISNRDQFDYLVHRENSIMADRKTIEASGTPGTVASIGMGLIDPGPWIAMGAFGKAASLAGLTGRGLMSGAARGAVEFGGMGASVSAAEAAYDPNYTAKDAALNIGLSTLLGGAIGGGLGLLSKKEMKVLTDTHELDTGIRHFSNEPSQFAPEEIRAAYDEMPRPPETHADLNTSASEGHFATDEIMAQKKYMRDLEEWQTKHSDKMGDIQRLAAAERAAQDGVPTVDGNIGNDLTPPTQSEYVAQTASLSAANNPDPNALHMGRSYEQMDGILGSNWLIRQMSKLHPLGRVLNSESVYARQYVSEMMETPREFKDALAGGATSSGGAVETQVRTTVKRVMAKTRMTLRDAWLEQLYGPEAEKGVVAGMKADALSLANKLPEGSQRYAEFKAEVDRALRSGDKNPDFPMAEKAAKDIRGHLSEIDESLRSTTYADGTMMIDPGATAPKGDESWWARMWNTSVVKAQNTKLNGVITDWLLEQQSIKSAAQQRIMSLSDKEVSYNNHIDKLERTIENLQARINNTGIRYSERYMARKDTIPSAQRLDDRAKLLNETIKEGQEFIEQMRSMTKDPDKLEEIARLEQQIKDLRKEAGPMSAAEQTRIEKQEMENMLSPEARKAAKMVIGKQKYPEPPSFINWLVKQGGFVDELDKNSEGKLAKLLRDKKGGKVKPRGLFKDERNLFEGKHTGTAGDWAEKFHQMAKDAGMEDEFPASFGEDDARAVIVDAHNGQIPKWWTDADKYHATMREAAWLEKIIDEVGVEPKSMEELIDAIRYGEPDLLQRLEEKAQAAGEMGHLQTALGRERGDIYDLRKYISKEIEKRNLKEKELQGVKLGQRALKSIEKKNMGRLGLLERRLDMQERMRDMVENALTMAESLKAETRANLEKEIEQWQGNSASEAIAALRKRREAEAAREEKIRARQEELQSKIGEGGRLPPERPPNTKRFASADRAVNRAIRRIIESDRDLDRVEMQDRAAEIIDRIVGMPDGRLPYDIASPKYQTPSALNNPTRGSLHSRDFAIPTNLVSEFINTDVEHVMSSYLRTVVPDLEMARRFGGDIEMEGAKKEIAQEYNDKIAKAAQTLSGKKLEKESLRLENEKRAVIADVTAMRDRIRNVYGWSGDANEKFFKSLSANIRNYTSIVSLGSAAINSFTDIGGNAALRYGLSRTFGDQYKPMIDIMRNPELRKLNREQALEFGIGVETMLGSDRYNINDIVHSYMPEDKFSYGLGVAGDTFHKLNALGPWTDHWKLMSFPIAQGNFIRLSETVAGGGATEREIAELANAGINPRMAKKIQSQLQKNISTEGGIRYANVDKWVDKEARDAFVNAVAREVDILVASPTLGEVPLTMSTWWGSIIGQFKSFMFASNERMLIANLQRQDARIVEGTLWMTTLGMLSYAASQTFKGEPISDNPMMILKEGLDRGTVAPVINEIAKDVAKFTGGRADPMAYLGASAPVSRRADNSSLSDFLGPAYSTGEHLLQFGHGAARAAMGGEAMTRSELHHGRLGMAYQNVWWFRGLLNKVEEGIGDYGNMPRARNHH